jgi:hypothetical protein
MPRSSSGRGRRSLTSATPDFGSRATGVRASEVRSLRTSEPIPVETSSRRSSTGRAPRFYRGEWGFDSSRRDCVARLVASPRVVSPWSRVRFPGDASSVCRSRNRSARSRRAKFQLASRRRRAGWRRHRSDTAGPRGSIPRSSTSRAPPGPRPGHLGSTEEQLAVGKVANPPVLGNRRLQVRLLPARLRGGGAGISREPHELETWVRVPPALSMRTLSTGRALRAVTAAPQAVVVRLHPSALPRRRTQDRSDPAAKRPASRISRDRNPRERIPVLRHVRGCSSSGRAPRLQREDAGSTPAISIKPRLQSVLRRFDSARCLLTAAI